MACENFRDDFNGDWGAQMNHLLKKASLALLGACLGMSSVWAHKGSDAYLDVQELTSAQASHLGRN